MRSMQCVRVMIGALLAWPLGEVSAADTLRIALPLAKSWNEQNLAELLVAPYGALRGNVPHEATRTVPELGSYPRQDCQPG